MFLRLWRARKPSPKRQNKTDNKRTKIDTNGLVSNFMWYFQRNDAYMRNEWSNYTNWAYDFIPIDIFSPSSKKTDNPNSQNIQTIEKLYFNQ